MGDFRSFVGVILVYGANEERGDSGKGHFKSLVDCPIEAGLERSF
jgi:hypothetical protein